MLDRQTDIKFKNKRSFTLAETLITLAMVGIIAHMTLPGLMQSYNEKVWKTQFKKYYAMLQQMVIQTRYDFGEIPTSNRTISNVYNGSAVTACLFHRKYKTSIVPKVWVGWDYNQIENNLLFQKLGCEDMAAYPRHTQYAGRCYNLSTYNSHFSDEYNNGYDDLGWGCIPKWLNGDRSVTQLWGGYSVYFKMQDGTRMRFFNYNNSNISTIEVDVNGLKPPNTVGKDVFHLQLHRTEGLKFVGNESDGCTNKKDTDSTGQYCAAEVILGK